MRSYAGLRFTKMEGCGNDYIYFDCFDQQVPDPCGLAVAVADRRFGVGGDGAVLILPSAVSDAEMRMYNTDGSEGLMCGNAIRCVAKYLYERRNFKKPRLKIDTASGVKTLDLDVVDGRVSAVTVDMGAPKLSPRDIPINLPGDRVVGFPLKICEKQYAITAVSMGNPHCVTFLDDVDSLNLDEIGPHFENHRLFPNRVNAEFVKPISKTEIAMRVYERGSGETLACGTGACACVVAGVLNGLLEMDSDIKVNLRGGVLRIRYTGDTVLMTGPAKFICDGVILDD